MKRKLLPFLLMTTYSWASADNMFDMSLEDLLEIEVEAVSKKAEPLRTSAGIVTVITSADIDAYGARNIKDVLQRLPNLFIFDSSTFASMGVMMRSGAVQHLNNRVLYLINGRPIRESQNGGIHTDINLILPIEIIEKIEMVRGPGSVLYGSNAFNGTINFITKNAKEELTIEASSAFGSYGSMTNQVNASKSFSKGRSFKVALSSVNSDGETLDYYDEGGELGSKTNEIEGNSIYLNAEVDNFSAQLISTEVTSPIVSGAFRWGNLGKVTNTRNYIDLGYEQTINNEWSASINTTINKLERDIVVDGRPDRIYSSDGYVVEGQLNGQLTESLQLIAGAENDVVKGDLGTTGGPYERKRLMLFSQLDYWYSEYTKLTAGVQWNDSEEQESSWSPRLAFNHKFNDFVSTKLLYSEAYRSPYGSEMYFDATFLQGTEDLYSETIKTYDAQVTLSETNWFASLTYFSSKTDMPIIRKSVGSSVTFINGDEQVTYTGFELEGAIHLANAWEVKGSLIKQSSDSSLGHEDASYGANLMLKLGVAHQTMNGHEIGIWYNYNSDFNNVEDILDGVNVVNPALSSFALLSANINIDLNKMNLLDEKYKPRLSLYANNLLNEDVFYPELSRKQVNSIQLPHSRGFHLKFSLRF